MLVDHFTALLHKAVENWEQKAKTTFCFIYYTGDAGVDKKRADNLYAKLNSGALFPLEHCCRDLASIKSAYVFAVFDCPRQPLNKTIYDKFGYRIEGQRNLVTFFTCKNN